MNVLKLVCGADVTVSGGFGVWLEVDDLVSIAGTTLKPREARRLAVMLYQAAEEVEKK